MKYTDMIYQKLFHREQTPYIRVFNSSLLALALLGAIAIILSLVYGLGAVFLTMMGTIELIFLSAFLFGNSSGKYQLWAIIAAVSVNMFLLPPIFLLHNGIDSGFCIWFVIGAIYTYILVKGKICHILVIVETLVYTGTYLLSYWSPHLVQRVEWPTDLRYIDIGLTSIFVAYAVGITFKYQTYIYDKSRAELELQKQLLQAAKEEAEKSSAIRTEFLANMSHEIKTPITAILGMNEIIRRESNSEIIDQYAGNIARSGEILISLVNDILDFTRLNAGLLRLHAVCYDVEEFLHDIYSMIFLKTDEKGLTLTFEIASNIPKKLFGDEIRIKQVLINLLTNAVKYTQKGKITLKMYWEDRSEEEGLLHVHVADTGNGIRKQEVEQIYNAFSRLEEEKNRNIEGAGLGLSIVSQLLEMMGGELAVNSEYGKGSEFSVMLPQKKVPDVTEFVEFTKRKNPETKQESYTESFVAEDARILLVDDNEINLLVVSGLLKKTKLQIDTATSGAECIAKAGEKRYDLIMLDYRMPNMDGIETMHALRDNHVCDETPIVALTANTGIGVREMYMKEGFDGYLAKPIDYKKLEGLIKEFLPEELLTK